MQARKTKKDVHQGTLALMVLKTLDVLGPLHGYGIARRIEQISGDLLAVNQGTLYPLLLKLEHEGAIASEYGASENNRRARFYRLTRVGRRQLEAETRDWEQTATLITRFFTVKPEDLPMRGLRRFLIRLTASLTRRRDDQRIREELEEHAALQTAENVRAGLAPAEARRQALIKLGAVEAVRESDLSEGSTTSMRKVLTNLLIVLMATTVVHAQPGLTGKWEGTTPNGASLALDVTATETTLTGTLTRNGESTKITDGKVSKNTFSFKATMGDQPEGLSGELVKDEIRIWLDRRGPESAIVLKRVNK